MIETLQTLEEDLIYQKNETIRRYDLICKLYKKILELKNTIIEKDKFINKLLTDELQKNYKSYINEDSYSRKTTL